MKSEKGHILEIKELQGSVSSKRFVRDQKCAREIFVTVPWNIWTKTCAHEIVANTSNWEAHTDYRRFLPKGTIVFKRNHHVFFGKCGQIKKFLQSSFELSSKTCIYRKNKARFTLKTILSQGEKVALFCQFLACFEIKTGWVLWKTVVPIGKKWTARTFT